jgi:hypothetical protein
MKNALAFALLLIALIPAAFSQTIGELVDLEQQIVRKHLMDELNKPAQGSINVAPAPATSLSGAQPATAVSDVELPKSGKSMAPRTTAIYGIEEDGKSKYSSTVEWGGASFEAKIGAVIRGYRVTSIETGGTMMVKNNSRVFAPTSIISDGGK